MGDISRYFRFRNSKRFLDSARNDNSPVQQKSFARRSGRKTSQMIQSRRSELATGRVRPIRHRDGFVRTANWRTGLALMRRRRGVNVDLCLALRLSRRCRRWIHDRRVGFLFLARRVGHGCFLLLTSRQKRGANKEADVFLHVSIGRISPANYLRCRRSARRRRGRLSCGAGSRFGCRGRVCGRGGGFGLLFTSRKERGASQDADVFLHSWKSSII